MIVEWLCRVKPPKYLRYLYFIAYSWYSRNTIHRNNAYILAIGFIGIAHMLLYESVYFFIFQPKSKLSIFIIALILFLQFYCWFYFKNKWKLYVKEFSHVREKQRKQHVIYLFVYLFICFVIAFFPILLDAFFDIRITDKTN